MVMLLKPVVPLSPVTVKDTVVVVANWFVVIVTLDICELVMFPLIARSTVAPLSVVAGTVVVDGVGAGKGAGDDKVTVSVTLFEVVICPFASVTSTKYI
jgi:hypothetical protein